MTEQQKRIDILEDILIRLHNGATPESVQEEFNKHFTGVSAIEISMMEHQLMFGDSEITFEDVLKLCNVHAKMFENNIDEAIGVDIEKPGHPVQVFKEENMALRQATMRIENILNSLEEMEQDEIESGLLRGLKHQYDLMSQFKKHYERKEKVFFPVMEKYGHDSPSKVMWGKDDEIRTLFDHAYSCMEKYPKLTTINEVKEHFSKFKYEFDEMVFKEEAILLNILIQSLTVDDWYQIAQESDPYGYAIISVKEKWSPGELKNDNTQSSDFNSSQEKITFENNNETNKHLTNKESIHLDDITSYRIPFTSGDLTLSWKKKTISSKTSEVDRNIPFQLGEGLLSINQVVQILEYIPMDLTFYSLDNKVIYFNHEQSSETRNRKLIHLGNDISVLYPKSILKTITKVFKEIKDGRITEEEFWFPRDREYLHYRFKGVYHHNKLIGIVEMIQNIQPYLEIEKPIKRELMPIEMFEDMPIKTVSLSNVGNKQGISSLETKQVSIDNQLLTITIEDSSELDPQMLDHKQPIPLNTGSLSKAEMEAILNALPYEISFVDHNDTFQYFNSISNYEQMIFKRTPVQIGRNIELCHPPHLWNTVDQIFKDFKSKKRLFEQMWFKKENEFINILYQANYDKNTNYLGTLETVEDIQPYIDKASKPKPFEI